MWKLRICRLCKWNLSAGRARSELEAMEKDARYALFYRDHQFQIAVREDQRQTRDVVSQTVQESPESYEVLMMQESQGVQNRYEGRMEENDKRVVQMIGSAAREGLRGQRNFLLQRHQVLLQAGEGENTVLKKPDALEAAHTSRWISKSFTEREVQQEHIYRIHHNWNMMRRR